MTKVSLPPLNEKEIARVKELFKTMPAKDIAKQFGRGLGVIYRALNLDADTPLKAKGRGRQSHWSDEQKADMIKRVTEKTATKTEITIEYGISFSSLAWILNVAQGKENPKVEGWSQKQSRRSHVNIANRNSGIPSHLI